MDGWAVGANSAVLVGSGTFVGSSVAVEGTSVAAGTRVPAQAAKKEIRTQKMIECFMCTSYHQQKFTSTNNLG